MADNIPDQQGNLPVTVGKKTYSPDEADQILANMQKIIEERSGALNTFLSGLKDAAAWTGGGIEGPTATLATRDRQKQAEIDSMLKMQMEMAQMKAAQEAQRQFLRSQEEDYQPVGGAVGAPGAPGAATQTQVPGVTAQGGQYLYRGRIPLSAEEYTIAKGFRTEPEKTKYLQDLVQERSKGEIKFKTDPGAYKEEQIAVGNRLRDVDAITKRRIMEDAQRRGIPFSQAATEYFNFLDGVQTQPTTAPGVTPAAIGQVETGGRPGLISPKGAMGVMQVMPNTSRDPGFGVTPARDNSQAELKRVGEDYYAALQKHYGNDTLAMIAYNMGPGNADAWIKKGGDFNALPKETQNYIGKVHIAQAQLGRQPGLTGAAASVAPVSAATTKPISQMSTAEIKQEMDIAKKEAEKDIAIAQAQGVQEFGERGKEAGTQAIALQSAYSNANDRLNSVQYVRNQMKNTDVIGILSKPGVAPALGTLLKEGLKIGSSETAINGLEQAIAQFMKGSDQKDIEAMQNIAREFAKMELTESRNYLKGQGAVSDNERRLITRAVANIGSSPGAINDFLRLTEMRANFDEKAGLAWEKFRDDHPKESYDKFIRSSEFKTLKNSYTEELKGFTESTLQPKQTRTSGSAGTTPNKTKWSIVQ